MRNVLPHGEAIRSLNFLCSIAGLDPDMSVSDFQDLLVGHSGVVVEDQEILTGYPPKPVEVLP